MAYCQGNLPDRTEVCDRRPRNLSGDHVSDSCNLNVEPLLLQFVHLFSFLFFALRIVSEEQRCRYFLYPHNVA